MDMARQTITQDLQLRYTWINSPALAWEHHQSIGHTDAEIVGGEGAPV
jgi:hypothetical protein